MRVVTYARVSTLGQWEKGRSVENQERAFDQWQERTGADIVARYKEYASAGTVEGRIEFTRMLRELPRTKPDVIVVDTLDRFTRSLREGLNLLEEIRGHGVGLLPIDAQRKRPIDPDNDDDWRDVVEEFTDAERERRRIRKRIRRSYKGREERGATFTNRRAFGLRRKGDHLEPDPSTAWIVQEVEKRVLSGENLHGIVRWVAEVHPKAWRTATGVRRAMLNENYVMAGARDPQVQSALRLLFDSKRFGHDRKHAHEFTGVFACGHCIDAGYAHNEVLMSGFGGPPDKWGIVCAHRDSERLETYRHAFKVLEMRVRPFWESVIATLGSEDFLERWAHRGIDIEAREREVQRQLADIDQAAGALKRRRDAAFDLLAERGAAQRQARKMLAEIEQDELALHVRRTTLLQEMGAPQSDRDPAVLRQALAAFLSHYEQADRATRNRLNRALCSVVGSHPVIRRKDPKRRRWSQIEVSWVAVEALSLPEANQQALKP